jgi:hypothetical protein
MAVNGNEGDCDECNLTFLIWQIATSSWQFNSYIEDDTTWNKILNFTGQHRCITPNQDLYTSRYIGYIVSSTGKYKNINSKYGKNNIKQNIEVDDALPIVELSTIAYDKKVFGVISLTQANDFAYKQETFVSILPRDCGNARIFCNGCGEGSIWCSDYNGILENGDYVATSPIAGLGMKQDDDILHGYTVAKITMDCDFEPKLIPVEVVEQEEYEYWGTSNIVNTDENVAGKYIEVPKLCIGTSNVLDSEGCV